MTNFENVIKGLEKVWDAFNHMEHELYADYVYDALELLKEQEKETDRILKVVMDVIYSGVSTDTEPDQDYVYELIRNGVQQSYTEKGQKPVKPIRVQREETLEENEVFTATDVWAEWYCPKCHKKIAERYSPHAPYCMWCGQAVKWG